MCVIAYCIEAKAQAGLCIYTSLSDSCSLKSSAIGKLRLQLLPMSRTDRFQLCKLQH